MIPKFKLETFVSLEPLWDLIPGAWDNVALPAKLDGTSCLQESHVIDLGYFFFLCAESKKGESPAHFQVKYWAR